MADNGLTSSESENKMTASRKLSPWLQARLQKRILPSAQPESERRLSGNINAEEQHPVGKKGGQLVGQVLDRWNPDSRFSPKIPLSGHFNLLNRRNGILSSIWQKIELNWFRNNRTFRPVTRAPEYYSDFGFPPREKVNPGPFQMEAGLQNDFTSENLFEPSQSQSNGPHFPASEGSGPGVKPHPKILRNGTPKHRIHEIAGQDHPEVSTPPFAEETKPTGSETGVPEIPETPDNSRHEPEASDQPQNQDVNETRNTGGQVEDRFEETPGKHAPPGMPGPVIGSHRPTAKVPVPLFEHKMPRISPADEHLKGPEKEYGTTTYSPSRVRIALKIILIMLRNPQQTIILIIPILIIIHRPACIAALK